MFQSLVSLDSVLAPFRGAFLLGRSVPGGIALKSGLNPRLLSFHASGVDLEFVRLAGRPS